MNGAVEGTSNSEGFFTHASLLRGHHWELQPERARPSKRPLMPRTPRHRCLTDEEDRIHADAKRLDPGIKTTPDELEKKSNVQQPSQAQTKNTAEKPQDRLNRPIEEQDKIARSKQEPVRTERSKERERER